MTQAFVEALLDVIPRHEIAGLYLKGSSRKAWESPLDYVPELSDLDVHLLLERDEALALYPSSLEVACAISAKTEHLFRERVASPVHLPRIQLIVANVLHTDPDFVPSPPSTVTVLLGRQYPERTRSATIATHAACRKLLEPETFLLHLPGDVVDKPARHLWTILRQLSWRVSPTGPRVLEVLGVPFEQAWSVNRTSVVAQLWSLGEERLASDYADYYLHAWDFFLSGYEDGDSARASILAASRVLGRGIRLATATLDVAPG